MDDAAHEVAEELQIPTSPLLAGVDSASGDPAAVVTAELDRAAHEVAEELQIPTSPLLAGVDSPAAIQQLAADAPAPDPLAAIVNDGGAGS